MTESIKKPMTAEEFANVCNNCEIYNTFEIYRRWCNYKMFLKNGHFDRSAIEVGSNIKEEV